jgi:RNA polymerase sigma factor (TIGR02999 family)
MTDITQLLHSIDKGDPKSAEQLLPLVYEELRRLAASKMAREAPGQTLQPTALVHEAWLKLAGGAAPPFNGKAHFFGAAAEAMRRILIDRARRKAAQRHGAGQQRVDIDEMEIAAPAADDELLAVNDALDKFAAQHPQKAELVKLRFFTGLTIEQAAEAMGISEPTANRWWAYARAWLFEESQAGRPEAPRGVK